MNDVPIPNRIRLAMPSALRQSILIGLLLLLACQISLAAGKRPNIVLIFSQTTFPPLLQKAGYQTALVGKWRLMQDPLEVAAGIERILEILSERTPETQIILQAVFPRGRSPLDTDRLNNVAINQIIRHFADGQRVHYLDVGTV